LIARGSSGATQERSSSRRIPFQQGITFYGNVEERLFPFLPIFPHFLV